MKLSTIRKSLILVFVASIGALGCELIVDFDRSQIPVETLDATTPDAGGGADTGTDAIAIADASDGGDATDTDAGNDADTDAGDAGDAGDAADAADAP